MEPFDTKIDRFGGRNLPQQLLSLSKLEFGTPFFSSTKKKRLKREENKVWY
jgi:hypothetical protein